MLVNHFLLLSCSTCRQCIVFLSSLVVLFGGNLLEEGQLFFRKILWWGGNFLRVQLSGGQFSLGVIVCGAITRGQFSSGAFILGGNCPWDNYPGANHPGGTYAGAIFLRGNCLRTAFFQTWVAKSLIWEKPTATSCIF